MTVTARPGLPTIDQVLAIPASARQAAPREWEDLNGHVTVPAYYEFHMYSSGVALEQLGWTEEYLERTGKSLFSVEQHLRFYDEALIGHEVSTHLRLLDRNERMMHGVSVLVNHTTGRVANTVEFIEGHVDLTSRRTSPFMPELAERLDSVLQEHRQLSWSVPLNAGMGLR